MTLHESNCLRFHYDSRAPKYVIRVPTSIGDVIATLLLHETSFFQVQYFNNAEFSSQALK